LRLDESPRVRTARSTAESFASLRAAGAPLRDEHVPNPDHHASRFIAPGLRLTALVKIPALRSLARRAAERMSPGAYFYELARAKHIDSVLLDKLRAGLEQLVILGAGFDKRAYRFAEQLVAVRVFEVDDPVAAALKKQRVIRALGGLPEHVRPVRCRTVTEQGGP
jgi:methyltransferase (TIGR00027 family)